MPTLGEILKREIASGPKSKSSAALLLGVTERTIENYINDKREPKLADLIKLSEHFGFPLSELNEQNVPHENENLNRNNKESQYIVRRREQKNMAQPFLVPLVPVKAQAGYARGYSNTDFINTLELYPILPGIDPRGAIWRYFEVQGDSMENKLFETDVVLVSMVPYEYWAEIKEGDVYAIITNDEVLIKKIIKKEKEAWLLRSENKRYKDRFIKLTEVKELWKYYRRITK